MTKVRVRFAPSPTGNLHVGGARTALFNWLMAKKYNGSFVLRLEDTDLDRNLREAEEGIITSLRWLGLDWDEGPGRGGPFGPYRQSERLDIYRREADRLLEAGLAYKCYCTPEDLARQREEAKKKGSAFLYNGRCRELDDQKRKELEMAGSRPALRIKAPREGATVVQDLIRGEVVFENSLLDDFVLLKSDGYPTYHLANVIDDHFMEISHVMRAEEWLSSTPRHLLLYRAFNWDAPHFAHLPMILGPDKSKLSKRHGATAINEYREMGYLPEAMINFLSLLGWSLDDKTEIMSVEEIIRNFSLERISKTAAIFNMSKLQWMNGIYIRRLGPDDFANRCLPFLERDLPLEVKRPIDLGYLRSMAPLVQERVKTLAEVPSLVDFFFLDELDYDRSLILGKLEKEQAVAILQRTIEVLKDLPDWKAETLEATVRPLTEEMGMKAGPFFGVLRVAVTGRTASPPLFQTMEVLGREKCLQRLNVATAKLK